MRAQSLPESRTTPKLPTGKNLVVAKGSELQVASDCAGETCSAQARFRSWCCENFPGGSDDCLTRMARQGDVKVDAPYLQPQNQLQNGADASLDCTDLTSEQSVRSFEKKMYAISRVWTPCPSLLAATEEKQHMALWPFFWQGFLAWLVFKADAQGTCRPLRMIASLCAAV